MTAAAGAVPIYHSNPTASAKLYIDFDGNAGGSGEMTIPAFDLNGDASTFDSAEVDAMNEVARRVGEAYSPFNLDVTTVDPGNLNDLQTMRVVVGNVSGMAVGGFSSTGGFSSPMDSNTAYVFPNNLSNNLKAIAVAVTHEAGHGFGLAHQADWSGSTMVNEYAAGDSLTAPIMGNAYYSARALWRNGFTSFSNSYTQDDLATLASNLNGFGYRADDHGGTTGTAATPTVSGTSVSAAGIIEHANDHDYFKVTVGAGTVNFRVDPTAYGGMLDAKLELRDAGGNLVASANTSSLAESLSATVAAGTYYVVVGGAGNYGDLGQYTLSGTISTGGGSTPLAVTAGSGHSATEGGTTALAATVTAGTASSIAWDLDGDGVYGETGGAAGRGNETGANVTFNAAGLDGPSTFAVGVRATAADGTVATATTNIAITNAAPALSQNAAPVGTINEGSPLALSFLASDPGQDTISSWVIAWGDGTTSTLAGNATSANKTYADNGTYTITLTATDEDGSYSTTRSVTVLNVAPTISITPPGTVSKGSSATFTLGKSDPGADTITSWLVNWGDGTTATLAGTATSVAKTYANSGAYTVTLTATDEDGSYTTTRSVTVATVAPTLTLTPPAGTIYEGSNGTYAFAATGPGAGASTSWLLNWGDGTTSTYAGAAGSVVKKYADNGTYTVTATATDADGSYSTTRSVTVANVAPTLSLSPLGSASVNSPFTMNFSASDVGADAITGWSINWGDGSSPTAKSAGSTSATKTYTSAGTYTVTLTATDEDGSYTKSQTVVVAAALAPTLNLTLPSGVKEGAAFTASFGATLASGDPITQWTINWGDGSAAVTLGAAATNATKTYADNGNYTVTLTAKDSAGTYSLSKSITIQNVAPTLGLVAPTDADEGSPITGTFSATDVGTDAITGWSINWGDGSATSTFAGNATGFSKTYADDGTYTITLTATDEDGSYSTTRAIAVHNVAPVLTVTASADWVSANAPATLSVSGPSAGVSSWRVDWGDGSDPQSFDASVRTFSYAYANAGQYAPAVYAVASDGTQSLAGNASVDVVALPTVSINDLSTLTDPTNQIAISVDYASAAGFEAAAFKRGDVKLGGFGSDVTVKMTGATLDDDGSTWHVTYTLGRAAGWDWTNDGTYTVGVKAGTVADKLGRAVAASSTSFDMHVRPGDDAGNDYASARQLGEFTPGRVRTVTDAVGPWDKTDMYRFKVGKAGTAKLKLSGLSDNADLKVFNGNGDQIASSTRGGASTESLEMQLPKGWIYARVYDTKGSGTTYSLRVDLVGKASATASAIAPEVGDSQANPIQLGAFPSGRVRTVNDAVGGGDNDDYYRFRLSARGKVNLSLSGLADPADLELLDGNGSLIAASSQPGTGGDSIAKILNGGWYFVHVKPGTSRVDEVGRTDYSLRLQAA